MIFSMFTKLCKHHHHLTPEYFHHPPKELLRLLEVTLHSPLPSPWKPPVCFLCLWTCPPWTSHADGIIQCAIFCIWLLSLSLMFSGFIHIVDVSVLHYGNFGNAPFYGYTTFLFIHPSADGQFELFSFLNYYE